MRTFLHSAGFLAADFASTLAFLLLILLTHNVPLAVLAGMLLGIGQIVWEKRRGRPVETLQWMSLGLVLVSGAATLITHDPRFVMVKPSLIYIVVGTVMLKPGWMNRYLPPDAVELVPDLGVTFGFVWAGLMFLSAGINLFLALTLKAAAWAGLMSAWGLGSKVGLFLIQYLTMRWVAVRRRRLQGSTV